MDNIWPEEKIRTRLQQLREDEADLNKKMALLNYQIKQAEKAKTKVAKMVSNNMRYRNRLISQLHP